MYWTVAQFPELQTLEAHEPAEVLRRVPWWTYPLIGARAGVPALLLGVLGAIYAGNGFRLAAAGCAVTGMVTGAAIAVFLYQRQVRGLRAEVRRAIADGFAGRRLPFCFACGYDLRAGCVDRCPECGHPAVGGPSV